MAPIRAAYEASNEWQEITLKAYPPAPEKKQKKKIKDGGTRYPGNKVGEDVSSLDQQIQKVVLRNSADKIL